MFKMGRNDTARQVARIYSRFGRLLLSVQYKWQAVSSGTELRVSNKTRHTTICHAVQPHHMLNKLNADSCESAYLCINVKTSPRFLFHKTSGVISSISVLFRLIRAGSRCFISTARAPDQFPSFPNTIKEEIKPRRPVPRQKLLRKATSS